MRNGQKVNSEQSKAQRLDSTYLFVLRVRVIGAHLDKQVSALRFEDHALRHSEAKVIDEVALIA